MTAIVTKSKGLWSIAHENGVKVGDLYNANPGLEDMQKRGAIPKNYEIEIPTKSQTNTSKPKPQSTSKKNVKKKIETKPKKKVVKESKSTKKCKCDAPWMKIVKGEIGTHEKNNRSRVEEYVAQAIWPGKKIDWVNDKSKRKSFDVTKGSMAWCSCFACWAMDKVNFSRVRAGKTPEKAYNWVRNFRGIKLSASTKPPYGSILILKNVGTSTAGHATFVSNYKISTYKKNLKEIVITALGGNQFDAVEYKEYRYRQYTKNGRFYQMGWDQRKERWFKKTKRYIVNYVLPLEYGYSSINSKCYRYNSTIGKRGAGDDR